MLEPGSRTPRWAVTDKDGQMRWLDQMPTDINP
jgi:hypothetical protein